MKLRNLLLEKRPAIIKRWFDLILETYPADTVFFLKKQKNKFANPVGNTIYQGIENIVEELLQGMDSGKVTPYLDNIIRLRAVQDFMPSQAVSFPLLLKKVIREELGSDMRGSSMHEELRSIDDWIDSLALISFDIYMKCREKIYELKANETKRLTYRLLQRANLICETRE